MVRFQIENTKHIGGWVRRPPNAESLWEILDFLSETVDEYGYHCNIDAEGRKTWDDTVLHDVMHESQNKKWTVVVGMKVGHEGYYEHFVSLSIYSNPSMESFLRLKYEKTCDKIQD